MALPVAWTCSDRQRALIPAGIALRWSPSLALVDPTATEALRHRTRAEPTRGAVGDRAWRDRPATYGPASP